MKLTQGTSLNSSMGSHFIDHVIKKSMEGLSSDKYAVLDDHTHPHHEVTLCQMTLFVIYVGVTFLYAVRAPRSFVRGKQDEPEPDVERTRDTKPVTNHVAVEVKDANDSNVVKESEKASVQTPKRPPPPPPPTFDAFLKCIIVFGAIMGYYFLCDYIKVFPAEPRVYSRDTFLFLVFLLFLVACVFTIRPTKDIILNREQTEEWKGWMQVMFVWYHYFAAKEWYNWIRVYIACYVWMTGFGNFSFFWVRKDFSLWRIIKMMFRLNFLVIFVVMTTNNEYMLYYICAMHTYWFITVYVFMRVLNSWNQNRIKMAVKFAAYIICNALIFEISGACSTLFRPLWFIFGLHETKHDIMHEWEFRAGLDHWACLTGMLCAYNYPYFEALLKRLEKEANSRREKYTQIGVKIIMIVVALAVGVLWYTTFMRKDKYAYNRTHCYSSMIPILVFIVLRNCFPVLRRHYIHMFAWLGKITLETYLSQLHIYLQSNAKDLLGYLVDQPLLNFALATIIYLLVSYMLFHLTTEFSSFLIPKDLSVVSKYAVTGAIVVAVAAAVAFGIQVSLGGHILV
ncbi:protein REDUCED WALL ACETYLATION 2-like isoform X1 [Haliotis rufescens]|uniref:protein REDUCED WALL ACETYLATION 2-like isoform X1 n=2 Tax=Haliotis rufescens TaxID=6454 RepID=UPI00201F6F28|nr:protein REDUCED WALL ACETYLATION 2-like isoform X1 [Haliotis rufescens]